MNLDFFTTRIGKRIYRDKLSCKCDDCQEVKEDGLVIMDQQHAEYLHMVSNDMMIEYRDNKKK